MKAVVAIPISETPMLDLTHVISADIEAALFKAYPDEEARTFYAKVAEQLAGNRWYPHTLFLTLALTSMTHTTEQLPTIARPLPQWIRFVPDIFDLRSYLIACYERQHLKEVRQELSTIKPSLTVSEHMLDWAESLSSLVRNSAFLEAFQKLWYDYQEVEK